MKPWWCWCLKTPTKGILFLFERNVKTWWNNAICTGWNKQHYAATANKNVFQGNLKSPFLAFFHEIFVQIPSWTKSAKCFLVGPSNIVHTGGYFCLRLNKNTLPKTNILPLKAGPSKKQTSFFQPSISQGDMWISGRVGHEAPLKNLVPGIWWRFFCWCFRRFFLLLPLVLSRFLYLSTTDY